MSIEFQIFNAPASAPDATELAVIVETCEKHWENIKYLLLGSQPNPSSLRTAGNIITQHIPETLQSRACAIEKITHTVGHSMNALFRIGFSPLSTMHRCIQAVINNPY